MSDTKTYTEDQVSEAVNAAMNMILGEIEIDDPEEDMLSLMVNATMTILHSGAKATFEDVVMGNYGEDVDEFKSTRGF
jgi:hypothetical protein